MANVSEFHYPGDKLTYTAKAAITGGQLVKANGTNGEVIVGTADALNVLGVAMIDAASDTLVSVASKGVWPIVASGAINAGDRLVAGAAGAVKTVPAAGGSYSQAEQTIPSRIIGIALTDAADTEVCRVKLINLG